MKQLLTLLIALLCVGSATALTAQLSPSSLGGSSALPGSSVSGILTITNDASVAVSDIVVSVNAPSYNVIFGQYNSTLAAGASQQVSVTLTVPSTQPAGTFLLDNIRVSGKSTSVVGSLPVDLSVATDNNIVVASTLPNIGLWHVEAHDNGFGVHIVSLFNDNRAFPRGWVGLNGNKDNFAFGVDLDGSNDKDTGLPSGFTSGGKLHTGPAGSGEQIDVVFNNDRLKGGSGWIEIGSKNSNTDGTLYFAIGRNDCTNEDVVPAEFRGNDALAIDSLKNSNNAIVLGSVHVGDGRCYLNVDTNDFSKLTGQKTKVGIKNPSGISGLSGKMIVSGWMDVVYVPAAGKGLQTVTQTVSASAALNVQFGGTISGGSSGSSGPLQITRVKLDCGKSETVDRNEKVDEILPGTACDLVVRVENRDSDLDIEDIELELEPSDSDVDDASEDVGDIDSRDEEDVTLSFEIDEEADGTVQMVLSVSGVLENGTSVSDEFKFSIEVEKPKYSIKLSSVSVSPSDMDVCFVRDVEVSARVENFGSRDVKEASVKVVVPLLGFEQSASPFELDEDDDQLVRLKVAVPKTVKPGSYNVEVSSFYGSTLSDVKTATVVVKSCEDQSSTAVVPVQTQPNADSENADGSSASATGFSQSAGYTAFLIVANVVGLIVLGVLAFQIFGKKY